MSPRIRRWWRRSWGRNSGDNNDAYENKNSSDNDKMLRMMKVMMIMIKMFKQQ